MKTDGSLYRSLVRYAVPISILCLIGANVLSEYERSSANSDRVADERIGVKEDVKAATKMVDAISNHNKPPTIVKRRRGTPTIVPLFSKDYDWKEDQRVQKALKELSSDNSLYVWEALVQKTIDRQYCMTTYSWSSDDAKIYSVGKVCHVLAYDRLCGAFERDLPSVAPYGCPIRLETIEDNFLAWRKGKKEKALYQLQIEACEMAIRKLPDVDRVILSDKGKAQARKKIEADITELRKSRKPIIGSAGVPIVYPQRTARMIREASDAGSLENFNFRLNK